MPRDILNRCTNLGERNIQKELRSLDKHHVAQLTFHAYFGMSSLSYYWVLKDTYRDGTLQLFVRYTQ